MKMQDFIETYLTKDVATAQAALARVQGKAREQMLGYLLNADGKLSDAGRKFNIGYAVQDLLNPNKASANVSVNLIMRAMEATGWRADSPPDQLIRLFDDGTKMAVLELPVQDGKFGLGVFDVTNTLATQFDTEVGKVSFAGELTEYDVDRAAKTLNDLAEQHVRLSKLLPATVDSDTVASINAKLAALRSREVLVLNGNKLMPLRVTNLPNPDGSSEHTLIPKMGEVMRPALKGYEFNIVYPINGITFADKSVPIYGLQFVGEDYEHKGQLDPVRLQNVLAALTQRAAKPGGIRTVLEQGMKAGIDAMQRGGSRMFSRATAEVLGYTAAYDAALGIWTAARDAKAQEVEKRDQERAAAQAAKDAEEYATAKATLLADQFVDARFFEPLCAEYNIKLHPRTVSWVRNSLSAFKFGTYRSLKGSRSEGAFDALRQLEKAMDYERYTKTPGSDRVIEQLSQFRSAFNELKQAFDRRSSKQLDFNATLKQIAGLQDDLTMLQLTTNDKALSKLIDDAERDLSVLKVDVAGAALKANERLARLGALLDKKAIIAYKDTSGNVAEAFSHVSWVDPRDGSLHSTPTAKFRANIFNLEDQIGSTVEFVTTEAELDCAVQTYQKQAK